MNVPPTSEGGRKVYVVVKLGQDLEIHAVCSSPDKAEAWIAERASDQQIYEFWEYVVDA